MRLTTSDLLELIGAALVLLAAAAWDWRALVALVGVLVLVAGYLLGVDDEETM